MPGSRVPAAQFSKADSGQSLPVQLESLSSQCSPSRRKDPMSETEVHFLSLGIKQKATCLHAYVGGDKAGNSETWPSA